MIGINSKVRLRGQSQIITSVVVGVTEREKHRPNANNTGWVPYMEKHWVVQFHNAEDPKEDIQCIYPVPACPLLEVHQCDEPVKVIDGVVFLESEAVLVDGVWKAKEPVLQ